MTLFLVFVMQASLMQVMPLTRMKCITTEGFEAPADYASAGELCFKGRSVFMGYLNLPDQTNSTVSGGVIIPAL